MSARPVDLDDLQARDAALGLVVTDFDGNLIWREPLDILRDAPVPAFGDDTAPPIVRRLALDFSSASGFDPAGVQLAALVIAAAAIDDRYRLEVLRETGWYESARLWGVLICPPSAGKSPILKVVSEPIKRLHADAVAQWLRDHPDPKADGVPARPAIFTSDATTEKLSELLRGNPRGLLMLTEEFASWIGGIDGYREGAAARGRGEWLQLYDGGPHQIDRVQRGSFLVPNWSCGVLAAATPKGLRDHVKKLADDGLIHRFMPVVLRRAADEAGGDATAAREAWDAAICDAFRSTTREKPELAVRLSPKARALFLDERRALRELVDASSEAAPALASHLGKHPGMIARLALVFHVLDGRRGPQLDEAHIAMAINFLRVVQRHAAALFGSILNTAPAIDLTRQLAMSIVASRLAEVSRNAFAQHCRAWRGASDAEQRQAVQMLIDANWLAADEDAKPYGGWARRWLVNPKAIERFAEHGRARTEARRRVAELLAGR